MGGYSFKKRTMTRRNKRRKRKKEEKRIKRMGLRS